MISLPSGMISIKNEFDDNIRSITFLSFYSLVAVLCNSIICASPLNLALILSKCDYLLSNQYGKIKLYEHNGLLQRIDSLTLIFRLRARLLDSVSNSPCTPERLSYISEGSRAGGFSFVIINYNISKERNVSTETKMYTIHSELWPFPLPNANIMLRFTP